MAKLAELVTHLKNGSEVKYLVSDDAGNTGKQLVIQANKNIKTYELKEVTSKFAPNQILVKRVGKDLVIHMDVDGKAGESSEAPDIILKDYYSDNFGQLVGVAEDGNIYPYIPQEGEVTLLSQNMADSAFSYQSLGSYNGVVGTDFNLSSLGLGALLLGGLGGGGGGSNNNPNNAPTVVVMVTAEPTIGVTTAGDQIATSTGSDEDGDMLVYSITIGSDPNGYYEINSTTGVVILTAAGANYVNMGGNLPDVNITVTDPSGATGTDSENVPATDGGVVENATPLATPSTSGGDEDTNIAVELTGTDMDGTIASVTVIALPLISEGVLYYSDGTTPVSTSTPLTPTEASSLMFIPAANFNGEVTITFTVTDNLGATSVSANEVITVNSVNDAPVAVPATGGNEDMPIDVLLSGSDVDGTIDYITVVTLPDASEGVLYYSDGITPVVAGNPLTPDEASKLIFIPTENFNGSVYIEFSVTDNDGATSAIMGEIINVYPVNDAPTIEVTAILSPTEDSLSAGAVVATSTASDVDSDTLIYFITAGSDTNGYYEIDSATGVVTLTAAGATHVNQGGDLPDVNVTVNDGTTTVSDSASVTPTVQANDPLNLVVTPVIALIEDNVSEGTVVATSSASDEDGGDITYSIDNTTNYNINSATGEVTLTADGAAIVNIGNNLPVFTVTAQSTTGLTSTNTANVTPPATTNVNDPLSLSVTPVSLIENSVNEGDTVATSSASDEDGGNIVFSISDTIDASCYEINTTTGTVTLTATGAAIVNSGGDLHPFTITAQSTTGLTSIAQASVPPSIEDFNDPLNLIVTPVATLTEDDVHAGAVVATSSASDEDGGTITYTISDTDNYAINPATGVVTLTAEGAAIVNKGDDLPNFTVIAQSTTGLTSSNIASVTLPSTIDMNDAPEIEVTVTLAPIEGNVSAGTVVATTLASDEDGDSLVYSITMGSDINGYYEINEDTGVVTLTATGAAFVNTGGDLPDVNVTVSDGITTASDSASITATIDVNDPLALTVTPVIALVEDDVSAGAVVATSSASDEDGGDIVYSISDTVRYAIDSVTGEVTLTAAGAAIVNAGAHLPSFTVIAQSTTGLTSSNSVNVDLVVISIDDGLIINTTAVTSISENSANEGDTVGTTTGSDVDGGTITYTISDTTNYAIDPATGAVTLTADGAAIVNRGDDLPGFTVTGTSTSGNSGNDNATPPATTDVNDGLTIDVTPVTTLTEDDVTAGTTVATTTGSDVDGGTITYTISDTTNYAIDPATGAVTLTADGAAIVNRGDDLPGFTVTGTSTSGNSGNDNATPPATTDVNDAPEVTVTVTLAPTEDAVSAGDEVATTATSDEDGDTLTYSITAGSDTNGYYEIDSATGVVTLSIAGTDYVNAGGDLPDVNVTVSDGTTTVSDSASVAETIDATAPTAIITMSDNALIAGETSTVTITFDEAVTNFNNSDVTAENGTLSTFTTNDGGITWSATFTPTNNIEDTTNAISLSSTYTDIAGNAGTTATSNNYVIDTIRPTPISIELSNPLLTTINNTSIVTIIFNEPVVDFDSSDVYVENGSIGPLTSVDGGITWTGTLSPPAYGVSISDAMIAVDMGIPAYYQDLAGNEDSGVVTLLYAIDTSVPTGAVWKVEILLDSNNDTYINTIEKDTATTTDVKVSFNTSVRDGDVITLTDGITTWTQSVSAVDNDNNYIIFTGIPLPVDGSMLTVTASLTADDVGNPPATIVEISDSATIDTTAPTITLDEISDNYINALESGEDLTISGTTDAEDGQNVTINFNGTNYTATVAAGVFSATVPVADVAVLSDGITYTATATVSDLAGNTATDTEDVIVDTTPPAVTEELPEDSINDTGASSIDNITSNANPTLSGTTEPYSEITVTIPYGHFDDLVYTTTADSLGNWNIIVTSNLFDGIYTPTVTATDSAGNTTTINGETFTVDTNEPVINIDTTLEGNNIINISEQTGVTISGTIGDGNSWTNIEDGQIVTVILSDGINTLTTTAIISGNTWTATDVDVSSLNDGNITVTADVTDVAGNVAETATTTLTKDTVAPNAPISILDPSSDAGTLNDGITNDTTPTISGNGANPGDTITVVMPGTGETLTTTVAGDGTWDVTPTQEISSGTVMVTATDSAGNASPATEVVLIIDAISPDANNNIYTISEDFTSSSVSGDLSTNDTDLDGSETYNISGSNTGAYGTLTINPDGTYTYVRNATELPQNFASTTTVDTFTYSVTDVAGNTDTATLDIQVVPVNDAPIITGNTTGTGNEDTVITGTLSATDVDGMTDGTYFTVTGTASHGTASINAATGVWSYTPTADYNGSDSFVVTITDDQGFTTTQTISLTVSPIADIVNNTATTNEDTAVTTSVLTNDTFEGTPTITATTNGAHGTVVNNGNGTVTYTPTTNWYGTDTYTYTVTSGGVTETATVTVTVNPVNDAPIITGNTTGTGNEDTVITGTLSATDVDGMTDGTYFTVTGTASHGTASINAATGVWSYTPTADYNGSDSFVVTITDDQGFTTTQTISLTVSPIADIVNNTATTNEDTAVTTSVLTNDTFEGTPTITATTNGAHGTVVNNGNGTVTYTPTTNWYGTDTYTYTVTSGGVTETATVTVTVNPVNDAPVNTVSTAQSTNEDTAKVITGLSISDADAGSGTVTVTLSVAHGTIAVTGGTATISGSGTSTVTLTGTVDQINATLSATNAVTYNPTANYSGSDTLTMTTSDGGNTGSGGTLTDTDTVGITVTAVNDAPVNTVSTAQSTNEDTAKVITGLSISDADAGSGTVTVTLSVAHGTIAVTGGTATISGSGTSTVTLTGTVDQINATLSATNAVTYNPTANYSGSDTLTMTTSDGGNTGSGGTLTDTDTVGITIAPVSDTPSLSIATTSAYSSTIDFSGSTGYLPISNYGTPVGSWLTDNSSGTIEVETTGTFGVSGMSGNVMELEQHAGEASNIYTDIATQAGEVYTFSFQSAGRSTYTTNKDSMLYVYWDGQLIDVIQNTYTAATTYTYKLIATDSSSRLEIISYNTNSTGAIIDNLSITKSATPTGIAGYKLDLPTVTASLNDTDGSETLYVGVSGIPTGWSISDGSGNTATSTGSSINISSFDLSTLYLVSATGASGNYTLTFTATATDGTATSASTTQNLTVSVISDATPGIYGTPEADNVTLTTQTTFWGLDGNDTITGDGSAEQIYGGAGNDTINGNGGADEINGGSGNDTIQGGSEADYIQGGAGNDLLYGNTISAVTSGYADTFIWTDGDQGTTTTPATDIVYGFGSNDVISLTDLFSRSADTGTELLSYIDVVTGTNSTLYINTSGTGTPSSSNYDQAIVLNGVDLSTYGSTDQAILQAMINSGVLVV